MSLRWVLPGLVSFQVVRVSRQVPSNGQPAVAVGARVEPDDVVARGTVFPDSLVIDVARSLELPPERVAAAITVRAGQQVAEGQVLAQAGWRGGRRLLAPMAGNVEGVDETAGFIALRPLPKEILVTAGVRGTVEAVSSSEVVISTYGHKLYGAVGTGGEAQGTVKILTPGGRPSAEEVGIQFAYSILVTTAPMNAEMLRRASEMKVKAVVAPSISVAELAAFMGVDVAELDPNALPDCAIPLLLTEGFGGAGMSKPLADLLSSCDGQEGLLVAQQPAYGRRSSLVISLPRMRPEAPELPKGLARLVDPDLLGGHVVVGSFRQGAAVYDVASAAIEVRDEDGTSALVPVVDLEELSPLGD